MKDPLFEAQLLRTMGYGAAGAAEPGECLATAARIRRTDPGVWYREWFAQAERSAAEAAESEARGDLVSARGAHLRASNAYRTAGIFLLGTPVDPRLRESHRREVASFRRGVALLAIPPEVVEIPFEDGPMPGYFFRAAGDEAPRPTVILTGGYDGTAEELYFATGAAALARGYHVLAFDGPGQGAMLLDRGVPIRPDWERVITPVVDALLERPEVDPAALALIGWSFGGYLAPRAATVEHRLAACVSDCGPVDLFDAAAGRIPAVLRRQVPDGDPRALAVLDRLLRGVLRRPTAGWALRRNLLVHGLQDPLDYFRVARDYSLRGRAAAIRCPTLVCWTDADDLSARAPELVAELTCPASAVCFRAAEGAGAHCESGARSAFHRAAFDWLATVLPAVRTA